MIITVEDLKKQVNCGTATDDLITAKLEAIEAVIRAYTNNNFQQRSVRFAGMSEDFRAPGTRQSTAATVLPSGFSFM